VAPLKYRARALVSLSAISWVKNQPGNTLKYCIEATKIERLDLTAIQALRGIAVLKGREGFHHSSLKDLENLYPIMKHTPPHLYLDYLNSLAVELAECDRLEEAQNISKITCSSPLVVVYPEWRETGQDLALRGYRSRSSIPIIQTFPGNLASMPKHQPSATPVHSGIFGPAPVVSLEEWKEEKMAKESNGNDEKDLDEMNDKDLFMEIMRVASQDFITSKKLRKMVDALKKIASEKD
jgi:hypothetical protein